MLFSCMVKNGVSEFGKVEVTSTPGENSFFRDFIFTYIPNLDIPPKIFRGAYQEYFREKHCFLKKGVEIWAYDGKYFLSEHR
jgi:hypothetical protein